MKNGLLSSLHACPITPILFTEIKQRKSLGSRPTQVQEHFNLVPLLVYNGKTRQIRHRCHTCENNGQGYNSPMPITHWNHAKLFYDVAAASAVINNVG